MITLYRLESFVRRRNTSPFDISPTETRTMSKNGEQERNQVFTDAENYIKQASDMLQREAARLCQEQETIDAMSK